MNKNIKLSVIALMSFIVGGCACACGKNKNYIDSASYKTYLCENKKVQANFWGKNKLKLSFDGKIYELYSVVSASGAKYESVDKNPKISFWNKGDKALLEVGKKTYPECSKI